MLAYDLPGRTMDHTEVAAFFDMNPPLPVFGDLRPPFNVSATFDEPGFAVQSDHGRDLLACIRVEDIDIARAGFACF
jgi:hypothetical protein